MSHELRTQNPWKIQSKTEGNISDALVFFGATGDLAYKKIFPALHNMVRHGTLKCLIIGVAKAGWSLDQLRERARESIQTNGGGVDETVFGQLIRQLRYIDGDYADPNVFRMLRQEMGNASSPIHYLAIPPSMFTVVVEQLEKSGCSTKARIIIEKPFGRDLSSATELNKILHSVFAEPQIFRIDHYLAKEAVANLNGGDRSQLQPWRRTLVAGEIQTSQATHNAQAGIVDAGCLSFLSKAKG